PLGAALPNAHEPHPVEAPFGYPIPLRRRHVGEGNLAAVLSAQFPNPDVGVDLVDRRCGRPILHVALILPFRTLFPLSSHCNPLTSIFRLSLFLRRPSGPGSLHMDLNLTAEERAFRDELRAWL